jgi:hypothetical protein
MQLKHAQGSGLNLQHYQKNVIFNPHKSLEKLDCFGNLWLKSIAFYLGTQCKIRKFIPIRFGIYSLNPNLNLLNLYQWFSSLVSPKVRKPEWEKGKEPEQTGKPSGSNIDVLTLRKEGRDRIANGKASGESSSQS